ncbi:Poly-beta-1,6-N-acetyl-D-glucosamine synthase [archaeon HR01]|nr:Poly-beta-1,6-N-acetyl-D-glucosamine synthase [archaeon HR01]
MKKYIILLAVLSFITLIIIPFIVSRLTVWFSFVAGVAMAFVLTFVYLRKKSFYREDIRRERAPLLSLSLVVVPAATGVVSLIEGYNIFQEWFKPLLISSFTITFFVNLFSIPMALRTSFLEEQLEKEPVYITSVSVIIPAYNEEKWIGKTIEALLESDYPNLEIIVVDDGSTDRTYEIASQYRKRGVIVLRKENGGKASAINYGLLYARGEIIFTVDADSLVSKNAISLMTSYFRDRRVVGVAGNVRVFNRVNWLTGNQALEYVTQINLLRRATSTFGVVQVMPGPLSAFRKEVLTGLGRYDKDTVTEDFDITVKLLKSGGIVQAPTKALAYTEAPTSLRDFYRQRIRWYRGNVQVFLKHRDAFTNPRFGFLNYVIYPLLFIQEFVIPTLGILTIPAAIFVIASGGLYWIISLILALILLQSFLSLIALELEDEDVRLVQYAPFAVYGYKHLLDAFMLKAIIDIVFLRRRVGWTRARKMGYEVLAQH